MSTANDKLPIDQVLRDDADYSVVFIHDMDPDCCGDCHNANCSPDDDGPIKHSYSVHGITGVLEAMAQVLVVIDEEDLGTENPVFAQESLDNDIQRQADTRRELDEVRAAIARLDTEIQTAVSQGIDDAQDEALRRRSSLCRRESELSKLVGFRGVHVQLAQETVDFANKIAEIIRATKAGTLDLDAPMGEDENHSGWGWVPAYEPRRTVGALIYYYVKNLPDPDSTRLVIKTA